MAEYIDRDELLKLQFEFYSHGTHCYEKAVYVQDIKSLPSAEVKSERHGRWIRLDNGKFKCSVCGIEEHVPTAFGSPCIWNYCPNCGAKMDLEG